jgi:ankyrin repeat protein
MAGIQPRESPPKPMPEPAQMSPAFNAAAANDNSPAPEMLDRALLRAAEFDDSQKITGLIRRGANKDARHINGDTPLIIAAREGHEKTLALLLRLGANVALSNNQGETAETAAAEHPALVRAVTRARQKQDTKEQLKKSALRETQRDITPLPPLRIGKRLRAHEAKTGGLK